MNWTHFTYALLGVLNTILFFYYIFQSAEYVSWAHKEYHTRQRDRLLILGAFFILEIAVFVGLS